MSEVVSSDVLVKEQSAIAEDSQSSSIHITRIVLTHYRNYLSQTLEVTGSPVVLTGPNGSGKTNLLEAISLFSPGRGLRSVKLSDFEYLGEQGPIASWGVAMSISRQGQDSELGTGKSLDHVNKRLLKVDGEICKQQAEITKAFSVIWLTPQMDPLFNEGSSSRRKFLDRLVYNFDAEHAKRVSVYERAMRERAKLLQQPHADSHWLSVLEQTMAEQAVAIAAARLSAVEAIQGMIYEAKTAFPKAQLQVQGAVESHVQEKPALEVEEWLQHELKSLRDQDKYSGRTTVGTHRTDLLVYHIDKQMPASHCSTGEQKALLLSIILAEARAKAKWKQGVPVLLLDEVVAHLDEHRRASLFQEILDLKAQAWLTGTDSSLFKELQDKAQFFHVEKGNIT